MNKIITTIIVSFICTVLHAQPTLTFANVISGTGKSYTIHETTPVSGSQGGTGAAQTWNFGSISSSITSIKNFISPIGTPYVSSYPSANLCIHQASNYVYDFGSTASYSKVGESAPNYTFTYTDPEKTLTFPFTFNSFMNDAFRGYINQSGVTSTRIGTIAATADAYGNITTPAGLFNNALRLHINEDYIDTINYIGSVTIVNYHTDDYVWYIAGTKYPVYRISSLSTNGGAAVMTGYYLDRNSSSVDEELTARFNMNFYPNPAASIAQLEFELKAKSNVQLSLTDLIGNTVQEIKKAEMTKGHYQLPLNVNSLSNGIYFIHAVINTESMDLRILVQH